MSRTILYENLHNFYKRIFCKFPIRKLKRLLKKDKIFQNEKLTLLLKPKFVQKIESHYYYTRNIKDTLKDII